MPPLCANLWVMMSTEIVISVDGGFIDTFGFKPEELAGAPLERWLVDTEPLTKYVTRMPARDTHAHAHTCILMPHYAISMLEPYASIIHRYMRGS